MELEHIHVQLGFIDLDESFKQKIFPVLKNFVLELFQKSMNLDQLSYLITFKMLWRVQSEIDFKDIRPFLKDISTPSFSVDQQISSLYTSPMLVMSGVEEHIEKLKQSENDEYTISSLIDILKNNKSDFDNVSLYQWLLQYIFNEEERLDSFGESLFEYILFLEDETDKENLKNHYIKLYKDSRKQYSHEWISPYL